MDFIIIKHEKTVSTNLLAMKTIARGEAENGIVITADYQTGGKGTGNNIWESQKGKNLLFSLIITPHHIEPAKQFLITQIVSLSIVFTLKNQVPGIKIKWPNDIYAGEKKIAGILIQNTVSANKIAFSVIGVGVNVNQKKFSKEIPNPVSLMEIIKKETETDRLLQSLLNNFDRLYNRSTYDSKFIKAQYIKHLYRLGTYANYMAYGKLFKAKIKGITRFGQLVLEEENGNEKTFNFKEIVFVS